MIRFKKIKPKHFSRANKKSEAGKDALNQLNSFLNESCAEPTMFLKSFYADQGKAITYKELREAVSNGYISEETIKAWQQDYSTLVSSKWSQTWINAMETASQGVKDGNNGFHFDHTWIGITNWVKEHGAQYITNSTSEQVKAVQALIARAYSKGESADELARVIRPCIGLTKQQTVANANYYAHMKDSLLKNNPSMREATAEKKARESAAKYAEKQHTYRAQMIAQTEMAYAYNYGEYAAIKMAQAQGLLGQVHKIWSTAYDRSVCDKCNALEGMETDIDEMFDGKYLYPPAHPWCRCAYSTKEISKPAQQADNWNIPEEEPAGSIQIPLDFYDENTINGLFNNMNSRLNTIDELLDTYENKIINVTTNDYFVDTTAEWKNRAVSNSHEVKDLLEYTANGKTYKVDGRQVLLDYSKKEKQVAEILEEELGGEIYMVPRVLNPKGISTPDYIFRGRNFDLKELSGTSSKLFYNAVAKKKRQASCFILDISKCLLDETAIYEQTKYVFWSKHTAFVEIIVIIQNDEIVHIFDRKK